MNKPLITTIRGTVPDDLWQCVGETEEAVTFRYTGSEPVYPVQVLSPSGQQMPVLSGTCFAAGVTLTFPKGLAMGRLKICAKGDVIRNGKVVVG